jgi:hypothetical protein
MRPRELHLPFLPAGVLHPRTALSRLSLRLPEDRRISAMNFVGNDVLQPLINGDGDWRPCRFGVLRGGRTSLHRHDGPSTGRQFVRDVFEISPIEWGSIANLGAVATRFRKYGF